MTFEEIYSAIKYGDSTSIKTWLDGLAVTPKNLQFIDSLCIYCVKEYQLDILKILVDHAANINRPWNSSFLLEYALQLGRQKMIDYLKDKVDTNRAI